jgi:hypothetical protein
MDGFSKAGLLKDNPTSLEICEVLMPPSAVSWGVAGSFRKLKTEFPPRVWPFRKEAKSTNVIRMPRRTLRR